MRLLKLFALLLSSTLLAACSSLPTSGPIRIGPELSSVSGTNSFYYSPLSPSDGATPDEILSGFLAAGTGPQNDYQVAREYLIEGIRSNWIPNSEVLIQRSSPKITLMEDGSATVLVDVLARIDSDGRYVPEPVGTLVTLEYGLTKENSEWRISKAPDVTVLIKPVFEVIFKSFSVYFLDRQKSQLVPDLRWFPSTPATGTKLVNALLRGPSQWLKPAVISAIPSGTRLSIDAVAIDQGTALVDLTARALVATRSDRSLMKAQLAATLSQLGNVSSVTISIERSIQDIPDPQTPLLVEGGSSLMAIAENGLQLISGPELEFSPSESKLFESSNVESFAVAKASGWLGFANSEGIYRTKLAQIGSSVELIDQRAQLLAPIVDKQQYLWSVARPTGAAILATDQAGNQIQVPAESLTGYSIRDFQVSPEGSRVALVASIDGSYQLLVAAIVRDAQGVPLGISQPLFLGSDYRSVSWISNLELAAIPRPAEATTATIITLGGSTRSIAIPIGSKLLTSGGQGLYLLSDSGVLYVYRGANWSQIASGISFLSVAR